jgi:polyisoprenoid-binding protein YceI
MMRVFALLAAAALVSVSVIAQSSGAAQPPAAGQAVQPPAGQPPAGQPGQPGQRPQLPPLGPTEWRIDAGHSAASFAVKHNVVTTVRGQLGRISGRIEWDGKDVKTIAADVSIDVKGINTQSEGRDRDLRSPNFFDVENHPAITFKSKRVEPQGPGRFKLIGDLTIKTTTKEVALDVEGPAPFMKSQRGVLTGASATTKINRHEYGITWNRMIESLPVVGDEVTVTIDLELNRPALPGSSTEQP